MDQIKEAFQKVKLEIDLLKQEIIKLNQDIQFIKNKLSSLENKNYIPFHSIICSTPYQTPYQNTHNKSLNTNTTNSFYNKPFNSLSNNIFQKIQKESLGSSAVNTPKKDLYQINSADKDIHPANNQFNPANHQFSLNTNSPFKPQKVNIYDFSTGNKGVPADRQTNQQTNQQTDSYKNIPYNNQYPFMDRQNTFSKPLSYQVEEVKKAISSLDTLKKEIKKKFQGITEQEFLVFSTVYQLEEEGSEVDYKKISLKLGLTESSIRDYISRLIKKGLPINKNKFNNKLIKLSIPLEFKEMVSLQSLIQLRNS